jgi:hypothetical protein
LAVALSYPLILRFTSHVPGSDTWAHDEYTFLWSMRYFEEALLDLQTSPLHTELIFYPLGLALILYTYNLLAAVLSLPLQLATSTIVASNLLNLAATVLSGLGAFLLIRTLLGPHDARQARASQPPGPRVAPTRLIVDLAALVGALIYAFASNRAVYLALGHYNIYHTQWLPFVALYLVRTMDRRRWHDAIMAGLFAGFALLTDMLYGVLLLAIAAALLAGAWLQARAQAPSRQGQPRARGRLFALLLVIGLTAALVSAVLLVPTLRESAGGDYSLEGWGDAQKLSADLVGLVTPTALHPLARGSSAPKGSQTTPGDTPAAWVAELRAVETGASRFADVNTVFLGYLTLGLAGIGALTGRRRAAGWILLALGSAVLALGPLLQIDGQALFDLDGLQVNLPLPFIITHYLPFIKGYRAPNRFSIPLMLALAALASYGVAWILTRVSRVKASKTANGETATASHGRGRRSVAVLLTVLLAAGILFEHLAWPVPTSNATTPAPYTRLAEQPGDFAVLQLPMGWRNGFRVFGPEDTRIQWYQLAHQQPIISGNAVRNPPFKFDYFERLPLTRAIVGVEMYQPPDAALDQAARASAAELIALWNVRYLVVNPPVPGRYPYADTWRAARDYTLDVVPVDPQPLWDEDGVQVYAVQQAPVPFPFELDLGSRDTSAYRGPGWSVDEANIAGADGIWVDGRQAELYLPLRFEQPQPLELTLRLQPFDYPNAPQQTLSAELNGVDLGQQALTPGWQEIRLAVPAEASRSGLNRLVLRFGQSARPSDVLPGQGAVGNTGVTLPVDVEINSGGAAQDIAYITLTAPGGATEDASAGRRGYNLTAIDPRRGKVLDKLGFDTWANSAEADRLAEFVEGLPAGTIVLAAARDDASRFLTDRAVGALASLGSAVDLRTAPGSGHALIGVKGAAPGTATETTGQEGAYLGLASDRRPLAAAVDWLRLEQAP